MSCIVNKNNSPQNNNPIKTKHNTVTKTILRVKFKSRTRMAGTRTSARPIERCTGGLVPLPYALIAVFTCEGVRQIANC